MSGDPNTVTDQLQSLHLTQQSIKRNRSPPSSADSMESLRDRLYRTDIEGCLITGIQHPTNKLSHWIKPPKDHKSTEEIVG
jgi:hypothetical protein